MTASDDFESPYFDWDNDRLFDVATRSLIDRIAHDPRFTRGHEGREVAEEFAAHLPEDRRRRIENAAWEVFISTVGKDLERDASEIVQRALADPDFDALPHGTARIRRTTTSACTWTAATHACAPRSSGSCGPRPPTENGRSRREVTPRKSPTRSWAAFPEM